MKLIRKGEPLEESPGLLLPDGREVDVSSFGEDYDEVFFETDGLERLKSWLHENENDLPPFPEDIRYGSPIARPSKIVCIGLNYDDHARESGMEIPPEPVIFFKATSSFCGPNDNLILPRGGDKTDWEVELAFVIGKRASYVVESEAMDYLAGYALHNDYSERAFQLDRSGQWVKGKSCDTFAPFGPWLATQDEIKDPNNLKMWLKVNGETMQSSNSSNLHYKIPFLLSYVSQFMTLLPGDIISTGTPPGVGMGMDPQVYLQAGDLVELGIDQLGSSTQKVVPAV
ncbi:MAG: fumarylacetoacetate hydrolase family protein [Opitutae bacterium]|jgi:2,4-didehydro-3-deoxy-L-rhamnonate hydrolase|nr:fumarylacetoacetate hydrolase family protein [Opitutae bacterium]MDA8823764.1 fumarylacetoacetate hydrolase family protein [Opitutales bacterium]